MVIKNKLQITDSIELARIEERLSKKKAIKLFEGGYLNSLESGKFNSLSQIHKYMFGEIYDFEVNCVM